MADFSVCYASSNEYSEYTGISILSMLKNNSQQVNSVYLLSFGISDENKNIIKEIGRQFKKEIIILDAMMIMKELVAKLHIPLFEGSYATYARAFISMIIPSYDGLLLYVDSDTIINGSVKDLQTIDMSNYAYAGVVGMNQYYPGSDEKYLLNGNSTYYACGVLLYNLHNWREYGCSEMIVSFISKHQNHHFIYADQTIINNAIPEKFARALPLKFNYWGHIFRGKRIYYELSRGGFYKRAEIKEAISSPIIIHYKGFVVHPWLLGNVSSLENVYLYYKDHSPWKMKKRLSIYIDETTGEATPEHKKRVKKAIRYAFRCAFQIKIMDCLVILKRKIKKERY